MVQPTGDGEQPQWAPGPPAGPAPPVWAPRPPHQPQPTWTGPQNQPQHQPQPAWTGHGAGYGAGPGEVIRSAPPRRKSRTGVVAIVIALGLVLVVATAGFLVVTGVIGGGDTGDRAKGGQPSAGQRSGSGTASGTAQPSATPGSRAVAREPASLDSADTDKTPFEPDQLFPVPAFSSPTGVSYLRGSATVSAVCGSLGGTKTKALLAASGCTAMAVGVYLTAAKTVMVGVLVIPLADAGRATTVANGFKADATIPQEFVIWCPPEPEPGAKLCASPTRSDAYRLWVVGAYHRYVVIGVSAYTDGRAKGDETLLGAATRETRTHVLEAMPQVR